MPLSKLKLPAIVFILGASLAIGVQLFMARQQAQLLINQMRTEANSIHSEINLKLESRVNALERLARRFETQTDISENEFRAEAFGLYHDYPGFQAISWNNKQHIIKWIYPLVGNEPAIGLDLTFEETRAQTLNKTVEKELPLFASPLDLKQTGTGFIVFVPIFIENKFSGHISGVFRADSFFNSLSLSDEIYLKVIDSDVVLFANYYRGKLDENKIYKKQLEFKNLNWSIEYIPSINFIAKHSDRYDEIIFGALLLATLLTTLIVYQQSRLDLERKYLAEKSRARDILEQKQKELLQLNEQLEFSNNELQVFSHMVAHDLKAPVRRIAMQIQILEEEQKDALVDESKQCLIEINTQSRRINQLIDDLLSFAKLGRAELKRKTVSLGSIARSYSNQLEKSDPNRKVHFQINEQISCEGDAYLLTFVLENLIGNAWKFTSKKENSRIEFGEMKENGAQVYFVKDNGAGFDMQFNDKLFQVFSRLHSASDFQGTGIGLASVDRILRKHGGKIWAESAVDEGATFYFTVSS